MLRRRAGILRMSLVDAPRPPEMSLPVITASRDASSTKPWFSPPQVTSSWPSAIGVAIESTGVTPRPASRSSSVARWAVPLPSKTSAIAQPADAHSDRSPASFAVSP